MRNYDNYMEDFTLTIDYDDRRKKIFISKEEYNGNIADTFHAEDVDEILSCIRFFIDTVVLDNAKQDLKDKCFVARTELGLSQREFASKIGTNQTEISFIERGFIPENKSKIAKIEQYYDRVQRRGEQDDK